MKNDIASIQEIIHEFQNGYINRDLDGLDQYLDLFCDEASLEVIGTDAYVRGQGEWCLDKKALRKLISADWESWGDLRIDSEKLDIHVHGQTAWFATTGTVTRKLESEKSYENFMGYIKWVSENEPGTPVKEKLLDVLRGGIITLAEAEKGSSYIWPIRLTAILVKEDARWKFCQMTFSFPTIYPPDVRLIK